MRRLANRGGSRLSPGLRPAYDLLRHECHVVRNNQQIEPCVRLTPSKCQGVGSLRQGKETRVERGWRAASAAIHSGLLPATSPNALGGVVNVRASAIDLHSE